MRGSGDLHTKAEPQNGSRTMVASNDDGLPPPDRYQFQIRRTLGAGTHYLKVEGYDENETGPLHRPSHRRRQPGNTTATAQALTLGLAQDTDHFSITVEENTHVSIWATTAPH